MTPPRRILFITEGGLGDQVALTAALRAAKESFSHSFVAVFATYRHPTDTGKVRPFENLSPSPIERANTIFSTDPNVDELYILNRYAFKSLSLRSRLAAEWSVVRFLREKHFDTVISTFPHRERFILWGLLAGARTRVGARNQGMHWLLTHAPDIEKAQRGVVEYYCDLVRAIGGQVRSPRTAYTVPDDALHWADRELRHIGVRTGAPFVAVHPGASGLYKAWPPERYAALIEALRRRWGVAVVMVTGEHDRQIADAIQSHVDEPIREIDCTGSVAKLAAVLRRSVLCISNDSGPRHLAVAVGTPSLAFFRRHHDKEWDVYGEVPFCWTLKSSEPCPACPPEKCYDRVPEGEQFGACCVRMIGVEQAVERADALLRSVLEHTTSG